MGKQGKNWALSFFLYTAQLKKTEQIFFLFLSLSMVLLAAYIIYKQSINMNNIFYLFYLWVLHFHPSSTWLQKSLHCSDVDLFEYRFSLIYHQPLCFKRQTEFYMWMHLLDLYSITTIVNIFFLFYIMITDQQIKYLAFIVT